MQKNMSGSLNGVIDEMLSGSVAGNIQFESGGGSNVTITPTLESGTKIADFTIDETSGELYAPTPPSYEAGDNITIEDGVISATDTTYTAGDGITIENGVISADGGSSSGILYGNTIPDNSLGVNGNIYIQVNSTISLARYFRFVIYKNRNNNPVTQFSTLNLKNGSNILDWNSEATATVNAEVPSTEGPKQILDRNTSTKMCTQNHTPSVDNPIIINIDNITPIDLSTYNQYEWYTANDSSERDPVSFALFASNDTVNWSLISEVLDYNVTQSRRALGYEGNCEAINQVLNKFFKNLNEWINL